MNQKWNIAETELLLKVYLTSSREDILFNPPTIIQKMYESTGICCPCVHEEMQVRLPPDEEGHWEDCRAHKDWLENFKLKLQEEIFKILIKEKLEIN